ncbi:MAG: 3-octaprenyl-4-hydroxybenzoate carboxy-lyase [Bacteroidetes bacterium]|nr:MAG: 3-octaprenyl-4-hydroxybenzoate carboxy-lyase [Bacteroidota bacterium]
MSQGRKIVVAITGASGSIYAKRLLDYLEQMPDQYACINLVFSNNAKEVWKHELEGENFNDYGFKEYEPNDFYAPFASGSAGYDTMIICPSSMGTIGRIANGISNDLISRAADVILKEGKQLILVPRETPFNLIHLRNMTQLTEAGATIIPAIPSFYSKPETIEDIVDTVVHRVLLRAGFELESFQWGE